MRLVSVERLQTSEVSQASEVFYLDRGWLRSSEEQGAMCGCLWASLFQLLRLEAML